MPYAWQCDRCKELVTPRGGATPRFCPRCGQRLTGAPVEAPTNPYVGRRPSSGHAIGSLIFGITGLVTPVFGVVFGIVAIGLGAAARRRISTSRGAVGGEGPATAGLVLGILAVVFHLALCGRMF